MRVGTGSGPSEALVGVLVNHAAFLLGLAGLYRWPGGTSTAARPALAVWAIALFPASIMFSMVYPSAIMFAGTVWAFDFVEDRATSPRPDAPSRWSWSARTGSSSRSARVRGRVEPAAASLITCGPARDRFGGVVPLQPRPHRRRAPRSSRPRTAGPRSTGRLRAPRPQDRGPPRAPRRGRPARGDLVWRKLPKSWLVLTGLFLVLPLLTGMVGWAATRARRSPRSSRPARSCAAGPAGCVLAFFALSVRRHGRRHLLDHLPRLHPVTTTTIAIQGEPMTRQDRFVYASACEQPRNV